MISSALHIKQHMRMPQAGKTRLEAHLPALAHECWFRWHAALWQGAGILCQGLGRLGGAARTEAAAAVLGAGPAPIQARRLRALQLRLAARHMRRRAHNTSADAKVMGFNRTHV